MFVGKSIFGRGRGAFHATDHGSDDIATDGTHRGAHGISDRRSGLVRIGDAGFTRGRVATSQKRDRCDEDKYCGGEWGFHGLKE